MAPANDQKQRQRNRRRPATSCDVCHRRKTRCDRGHPCSRCLSGGTACRYERHAADVNARASSLVIAAQGRETSGHSSGGAEGPHDGNFQAPLPTPDSNSTHPRLHSSDTAKEVDQLRRRVSELEYLFSRTGQQPAAQSHDSLPCPRFTSADRSAGSLGSIHRPPLTLNKNRLFGQSHWTHGGREFSNISAIARCDFTVATDGEQTRRLKSELASLLGGCKAVAKSLKLDRPSRARAVPNPDELSWSRVERATADHLAHLYISFFESTFRIVHVPSFWLEYQLYWNFNPDRKVLLHKVQLVLTIGASIYQTGDDKNIQRAAVLAIHQAQTWLSGPLEKDRLSLDGLQVQCLLILARQVMSLGGDLIWVSMGDVVRTAMQMGLHRHPEHYGGLSLYEAQMRRRLWATILELNVQAALDSGAPLGFSLDDFDIDPPANMDDSELTETSTILNEMPEDITTDMSMQRFLLANIAVRAGVVRLLNGSRPSGTADHVATLTSKIEEACQTCSAYVRDDVNNDVTVFQHNIADLMLRRFLLCLHRYNISRTESQPQHALSRKICVDAATTILSPLTSEKFQSLSIRAGGLFKSRIIHIALAICSEILIELNQQGPKHPRAIKQPSAYLAMLTSALNEALNQCAKRIQYGETNIRMHMKGSVVLALAQGIPSGISFRQHMAQAAKTSLETSFTVLRARQMALNNRPLDEQLDSGALTDIGQDLGFGTPLMCEDTLFDDMFFGFDGGFDPGASLMDGP